MDPYRPMVFVGYTLSAFLFLCGIVIATGIFYAPYNAPEVPGHVWYCDAVIRIYRFVNIRIQQQQRNEDRFLS